MPKMLALIFLFPVYHFAFRSLLPMVLLHGEAASPSWQEKLIEEISLKRQYTLASCLLKWPTLCLWSAFLSQ